MLALVHALKTWKHYLMGSKVLAYTDNVALYWKTAQNLSHRHVRWLAYIGMFDLDIAHILVLSTWPRTPFRAWHCERIPRIRL